MTLNMQPKRRALFKSLHFWIEVVVVCIALISIWQLTEDYDSVEPKIEGFQEAEKEDFLAKQSGSELDEESLTPDQLIRELSIKNGQVIEEANYELSGKIVNPKIHSLFLNELELDLKKDGSFKHLLSFGADGLQNFELHMLGHRAGKQSLKLTFIVDCFGPKITIDFPVDQAQFSSLGNVEISGHINDSVSKWADCKLEINGKVYPLKAEGRFSLEFSLNNYGKNQVKLSAVDGRQHYTHKKLTLFVKRQLPDDLSAVESPNAVSQEGLGGKSKEAQELQELDAEDLGLNIEVVSSKSGIVFRWVPAGSFKMGSPSQEQESMIAAISDNYSEYIKESWPVKIEAEILHSVRLSAGLYVGKYEVTQAQWRKVMGKGPKNLHFENAGDLAAVEGVSWDECQEFLKRICKLEGLEAKLDSSGNVLGPYRLLTEAEWEYACRAGTVTATYAGELKMIDNFNGSKLDSISWYGGNSEVSYEGGYDASAWPGKELEYQFAGVQEVGQKKANAFGLHDMLGNLWEWCGDYYGDYDLAYQLDPVGPIHGSWRVVRGGAWDSNAIFCRSAYRSKGDPKSHGKILGFRICRVLGQDD